MGDANTTNVAPPRRVLCVPSEEFKKYVGLHGYSDRRLPGLLSLIDVLGCFESKDFTEQPGSGYKQVIPYVVVKSGGRVLAYQRSKAGGEGRLHEADSLGIGGHVEVIDAGPYIADLNPADTLRAAAIRELAEEFGLSGASPRLIGVVNDDTNEVGRAHVGVVMALTLAEGTPLVPGAEIGRWEWAEINEIESGDLESWSRHVLRGYLLCPDRRRRAS